MKKLEALILLFFITAVCFTINLAPAYCSTTEFDNQIINFGGNHYINGSDVEKYVNATIRINGNLTVEGTLILQNTTLLLNQTGTSSYNLALQSPGAGENPQLIVDNSKITSTKSTTSPAPEIIITDGIASLTNLTTNIMFSVTRSSLNASGLGSSIQVSFIANDHSIIRFTNTGRTGSTAADVRELDLSESTAIVSNCRIGTVLMTGHSNMTLSKKSNINNRMRLIDQANLNSTLSSILALSMAGNTTALLANSTIVDINAAENAKLIISGCEPYGLTALMFYGESMAQVSSSQFTSLALYDNSTFLANNIQCVGPTSNVMAMQNSRSDFTNSTIDNLYANGTATVTFNNVPSLQLLARDEANLTLIHVTLRTLANAFDNSKIHMENTIMFGVLNAEDASKIVANNCTVNVVDNRDSSSIIMTNSTAAALRALASSNLDVTNSTVKELEIQAGSINGTIKGFSQPYLHYWNFKQNDTITLLANSYLPNVTLQNMQKPQNLTLQFFGTSSITVSNVELENLIAQDNTVVRAYNSTITVLEVKGKSTVYSYWTIRIKVTNSQNAAISGADVKIIDPSGALINENTTDANGEYVYKPQLLASIINGTQVLKSLMFEVSSGDSFNRILASNLPSGNMTIQLQTQIPWWQQYWYLLATILILAALIVAIFLRRRKLI